MSDYDDIMRRANASRKIFPGERECPKCKEIKPPNKFYAHRTICSGCTNQIAKDKRLKSGKTLPRNQLNKKTDAAETALFNPVITGKW